MPGAGGIFGPIEVVEGIAIGTAIVPDQRLHRRYESSGNHQQIAVEHSDQVKQSVVSGDNFACLDSGDVHLRQAHSSPQFGLAPAATMPRFQQLAAHLLRQSVRTPSFDM